MNKVTRSLPFSRDRVAAILMVVLLALGLSSEVSLAAGQSVENFLKTKPRWPELVGSTFRIEGRLATSGGTVLKLHRLPLLFVSEKELPELRGSDLAVEVVGRLRKRDTGVLEFELINVRKTESDIQRVTRLRVDLPRDDPDPWYELGEWAMGRVRFYQSGRTIDRQLTEEATSLFRMALRKERTAMRKPNYKRLKELALKSERYGLGDEFKLPLLYEAHYQTWHDAPSTASSEQLATIAQQIATELPEAGTPIEKFDEEFIEKWSEGPVLFYTNSAEAIRPQLHRLLYQKVMLASIEKDAATGGQNGKEIAARIRKSLPEFSSLADSYERKAIDWQVDHVTSLSRSEVIALKRELIDSGEEARADEVLRRWLTPVESRLRQQGAVGLIELAFEYEDLFDDKETAIALLLESDRVKPGSGYVAERLESFGYVQVNGRWRHKDAAMTDQATPVEIAIRSGRVIRGMTSAQVKSSLGPPDSITRVLMSREVREYWVYRTPSRSGLSVQLSRPLNRHESIVRKVFDLPAR